MVNKHEKTLSLVSWGCRISEYFMYRPKLYSETSDERVVESEGVSLQIASWWHKRRCQRLIEIKQLHLRVQCKICFGSAEANFLNETICATTSRSYLATIGFQSSNSTSAKNCTWNIDSDASVALGKYPRASWKEVLVGRLQRNMRSSGITLVTMPKGKRTECNTSRRTASHWRISRPSIHVTWVTTLQIVSFRRWTCSLD